MDHSTLNRVCKRSRSEINTLYYVKSKIEVITMLKHLGLVIISFGFMCAYAASHTSATASNTSASTTTATVAETSNDATAAEAALSTAPEVVTAPMIFQVGKQKLEVNRADVVQIAPTDELCTDGVAIQLTDTMGSQLHDLTAQNQNQDLKIFWNGLTLGDATISTPIGANVCIGYVDTATEQALVSEFSSPSHQSETPAAQ